MGAPESKNSNYSAALDLKYKIENTSLNLYELAIKTWPTDCAGLRTIHLQNVKIILHSVICMDESEHNEYVTNTHTSVCYARCKCCACECYENGGIIERWNGYGEFLFYGLFVCICIQLLLYACLVDVEQVDGHKLVFLLSILLDWTLFVLIEE